MENVALFLHLVGAFSLVSGLLVAAVAFETARRRDSPAEIASVLGLARTGVVLVGAGALLAGVCGLWLVQLGHWGFGSGWVDAASGLFVAAMGLGGIGGQTPKRARRLAAAHAAEGRPVEAELRALLDDRGSLAVNYVSGLLIVAILVLMVWKPGA